MTDLPSSLEQLPRVPMIRPAISQRLRAPAGRLVSMLSRQFPVADRLTVGWLALEEHGETVDLLWWTATQLAEREQGSVVLVDGDERRKTLTRQCGLRTASGLTDLAGAIDDVSPWLAAASTEPLFVLPVGQARYVREAPARYAACLDHLKSYHRFSMIHLGDGQSDLPLALARACDAVFLLVRSRRTQRLQAVEQVRRLRAANVPLTGCVLLAGPDSEGNRDGEAR